MNLAYFLSVFSFLFTLQTLTTDALEQVNEKIPPNLAIKLLTAAANLDRRKQAQGAEDLDFSFIPAGDVFFPNATIRRTFTIEENTIGVIADLKMKHPNATKLRAKCLNEEVFRCFSQTLQHGVSALKIFPTKPLDAEVSTKYDILIEIWVPTTLPGGEFHWDTFQFDDGSLVATGFLQVLDQNDNAPEFNNDGVNVPIPVSAIGTFADVGVTVVDRDVTTKNNEIASISHRVISGGDQADIEIMVEEGESNNTKVLMKMSKLPTDKGIVVELVAEDSGTPRRTGKATVTLVPGTSGGFGTVARDISFDLRSYEVEVWENSNETESILSLKLNKLPSNESPRIWLQGEDQQYFELSSERVSDTVMNISLRIRKGAIIDRENKNILSNAGFYKFEVHAATSKSADQADLVARIKDRDDNSPVITPKKISAPVQIGDDIKTDHTLPGFFFTVADPDDGEGAYFGLYSFPPSNVSGLVVSPSHSTGSAYGYFTVTNDTLFKKALQANLTMTVVAASGGDSPFVSKQSFPMTLGDDVIFGSSMPRGLQHEFSVTENALSGAVVGRIIDVTILFMLQFFLIYVFR